MVAVVVVVVLYLAVPPSPATTFAYQWSAAGFLRQQGVCWPHLMPVVEQQQQQQLLLLQEWPSTTRCSMVLTAMVVSAMMAVASVFWLLGLRHLGRDTAAITAEETSNIQHPTSNIQCRKSDSRTG